MRFTHEWLENIMPNNLNEICLKTRNSLSTFCLTLRIRVRIDPSFPCVCCKRQLDGFSFGWVQKKKKRSFVSQAVWFDKYPSLFKGPGIRDKTEFCSPSLAIRVKNSWTRQATRVQPFHLLITVSCTSIVKVSRSKYIGIAIHTWLYDTRISSPHD
jgi:hypothetical protein